MRGKKENSDTFLRNSFYSIPLLLRQQEFHWFVQKYLKSKLLLMWTPWQRIQLHTDYYINHSFCFNIFSSCAWAVDLFMKIIAF
jgi:hypothetical protein